jgi:hypothetical protein
VTSIVADESGKPNKRKQKRKRMRLSNTQMRLLIILTWELRVGSEGQLASRLDIRLTELRSLGRRLHKHGLLSSWRTSVLSHDMAGPLASCGRGDSPPDFSSIAWQLRKRWLQAPRIPARILWATGAATRLVGGVGGRIRQPLQVQHDLGVAEIWARRPIESDLKWISEDIFRRWFVRDARTKVPDALLVDASANKVKRVLEYGGQYSRKRLEDFHRYWSGRAPYEIW